MARCETGVRRLEIPERRHSWSARLARSMVRGRVHGAQRVIDDVLADALLTPSATPTPISSMNGHPEMEPISTPTRAAFFSVSLALCASAANAQTATDSAQAGPPPAAAAPAAPSADQGAPPAGASAPAAPAPAAPAAASTQATTTLFLAPEGANADAEASAASSDTTKTNEKEWDPRGLALGNTLGGATGLLHTMSADSGGNGTFRVSILGTYYSGSGFLCPLCQDQNGKVLPSNKDKVSQIGTRFQLSVTPARFLEAFATFRYQSTSNDQGDPKAIQVVGDMGFGLKAFTPAGPDQIFSFGGAADALLLASAGGVGLDTASVGLHALGTADFTRRSDENARIPLRIHLNAGYVFDDSGVIADDIEKERAATLGNHPRITRVERFGHDINRVDRFETGLGVEGAFKWVRPFLEWTVDIPVNRQNHECGNQTNRTAGDSCLRSEGFTAVPSRFTVGARAYPWATDWLRGLAVLAAFDVGTGATQTFIEEVTPERPWAFHFGLSYAVDTQSHEKTVEKIVEHVAPLPPEYRIEGTVARENKGEPVANAVVRYVGRPLTGMVTDEQGVFKTGPLEPGEYRFAVSADGYRDGDCTATISAPPPSGTGDKPAGATPPPAAPANGAAGAPASPPAGSGPTVVHVACELEALPKTATITGVLRDAATTNFIEGATVTITDPLGRQLALKTDAEGTFRFGNVPAGKSSLLADADGYLRTSKELTLEPRKDIATDLMLNKRPATPNVVVTPTELKLKKEIHFLHGSAEILPDSMAILEEAADVIRSHPDLGTIEIQGHTDDTGSPDVNLRLSANRADAVRDVIVQNGVDASRLTAHGYGQEKPLVPNTSEKNRAKNRRVQLVITK
jgi:outer membrane protein OmpA-like peptidoglycan-associated protein